MEVKKLNSVQLEWGYCKICRRKDTNERYQRKKLEQKEMPIFKGTLEALKNL